MSSSSVTLPGSRTGYLVLYINIILAFAFLTHSLECPLIATADFAYIRLHGSKELYTSSYSNTELNRRAKKINRIQGNLKEIYVYFNNDARAFAVRNALVLAKYLEK